MSAPTRASTAGRAYLDLRKLARENHRPVDELLQLYILEAFLDRLTSSRFTEQLVLKGGVLLAAFDGGCCVKLLRAMGVPQRRSRWRS